MRNIKWFATAAATALILTSTVVWSTSNTEAFVAAPQSDRSLSTHDERQRFAHADV